MIRINVKSKVGAYPVMIGFGILQKANYFFKKEGITGRCILVCSQQLYRLYGKTLLNSLDNKSEILIIEDREESKSLETTEVLYSKLTDMDVNRNATIITLGGGVTGDLAGYVAATYLRGLNLVHIPTSLVAQVDSSIGGKVGVNYKNIKNAIGAFYPPKLVITDAKTLETLPEAELNNGLAEVIKSAIVGNGSLFHLLRKDYEKIRKRELGTLLNLISKTCKAKVRIVEHDEKEKGVRKILNFGHTFGHPLEMLYGYKHGEAVAVGMVMATRAAKNLNILEEGSLPQQLESMLKMFNLPTEPPSLNDDYWSLLLKDKKREDKIVCILPEKIGKVRIIKMGIEKIRSAIID